jgi:N-glycosylase/DNA lyase
MNRLVGETRRLQKTALSEKIRRRLQEFASFREKGDTAWFSELCFCILTANSKAETAIKIQAQLGGKGFCEASKEDIKKCIIENKHRFHNTKARFIVEARKHSPIKPRIEGLIRKGGAYEAREWLVKNVRGLGYKEASHFLRNVGCREIAILDRHVLNTMRRHGIIREKPKALTRKKYLQIEKTFRKIAEKAGMPPAELDLYIWWMKTGRVLK